ncbi:hypothetical protein H9185_003061 [Listeria monocytogenes]|nr:hypothetical protein [Listeria monocytogenes]
MAKWIRAKEQLPQLPEVTFYRMFVLACNEGDTKSRPMIFQRSTIRGKVVNKWLTASGEETYRTPDFWQYLPEPPKRIKKTEKECEPND